jgi:hypothetical protein
VTPSDDGSCPPARDSAAALAYTGRQGSSPEVFPMHPTQILFPAFALVGLTFTVLLMIPIARFRAAFAGKVTAADFAFGESLRVPPETALPNRNYMNLLEVPVLFYVACLTLYVTSTADRTALVIAWAYVGLRALHSMIHLSYNNVVHRLTVFAVSNVVLAVLWLRLVLGL